MRAARIDVKLYVLICIRAFSVVFLVLLFSLPSLSSSIFLVCPLLSSASPSLLVCTGDMVATTTLCTAPASSTSPVALYAVEATVSLNMSCDGVVSKPESFVVAFLEVIFDDNEDR